MKATRRDWIGLAVLALPCLVYAMDLTVLNLALPRLSADLRPSGTQLLWIVDVYGFMVAGALITMGALGDRIGGRRLLMIGAGAFAAASVLASVARTPGELIAARALLGLAGATVAPSTLSLIRVMFGDPRQRTVAIGVWVTSYSAGAAVGPIAGGALIELAGWRSVFLLALPVMGLLLVLGPRLLPEPDVTARTPLDLVSAGLSLAAVLSFVYGIKLAAVGGGWVPWTVAGLGLGAVFVSRQRRLADPLIDLALFRVRAFSGALATNLVAFFVVFGMSLFFAQYLQSVLGLSPLHAGLWSVPEALGFIAGSTLTPRLRASAPALIAGGMGLGALGYALVAAAPGLAGLVVGSTVGAMGTAVVITLVTDLAVGAAPVERAGAASAVAETSSELGGALGLAVLGSLGAAVYGGPFRAPLDAMAFTSAYTAVAWVGAGLLILGAAAAWALLRDPVAAGVPAAANCST